MRPLTSQFSASVARRDHVVKKTCVGAVPRTAADNGLGVLEVRDQRRDPLVDAVRVTAQTSDLPAVGEQTPREIASADAGDADDERAPAHVGPRSTISGAC